MKKVKLLQKVLLLIFMSAFSLSTNIAQTTYGYADCPPALYNNHSQGNNYGRPITISSPTLITDVGLCVGNPIGNSTILGVYSDDVSSPGNLLAETALTPLVTGTNEMSLLSPVVLLPGTYWIVANHVGGTGPLVGNDGSSTTTLIYVGAD